jgi:hypothetical protein
MQKAGMEAFLLIGGQISENEAAPHATLMYKNSDGNYVYANYSKSIIVQAHNALEAAKKVYKISGNFESSGTIGFQDMNNSSYQEQALEEATFFNEIDKRDYNTKKPLDNSVPQENEIRADITISRVGNKQVTLGGTLTNEKNNVKSAISLDAQLKTTNVGPLLDEAKSIGIKAEYQTENSKNGIYTDNKLILSNTTGRIVSADTKEQKAINENIEDKHGCIIATLPAIEAREYTPSYITAVARSSVGVKSDIMQNNTTCITNAAETSVLLNSNIGYNDAKKGLRADGRITIEDNLGITTKPSNNTTIGASVNGGIIIDALETCDSFRPTFGGKVGASIHTSTNLSSNLKLDSELSGTSVFTRSSTDLYLSGGATAQYRLNNNTALFASSRIELEKQNLHLGNLNETTRNNLAYSLQLGANIGNRTQVFGKYSQYTNHNNSTRSYQNFELGVNYRF